MGAIVASGDLGAVAGAKIADGAHLRERDVQIITAGGVVGVSLVILLESTDTRGEYEMPEAVLAITGAVAGGGFGWAIARSTEPHLPPLALGAFVSGTPDHLVFGLPVPTVFPTASGLNAQASLVATVF